MSDLTDISVATGSIRRRFERAVAQANGLRPDQRTAPSRAQITLDGEWHFDERRSKSLSEHKKNGYNRRVGESARAFDMARAKRVEVVDQIEMEMPSAPRPVAVAPPPPPPTPEAALVIGRLQDQVDDIARRHASPTPGFAVAPKRVLDERVMSRADEPFARWLLAQRDRGDWIDELAIAARGDRGFPKNGSPDDVRKRLAEFGATGDAFEQVDDAERDWMSLAE